MESYIRPYIAYFVESTEYYGNVIHSAQKMMFSIKAFFCKCDEIM